MNKSTPSKYRVAITPTSEQDLLALRYAFDGDMAHGEHKECRDDVLVAALLGWHLRKIGRHYDPFMKSVVQEFYNRASDDAAKWMDPADLALRKLHRGSPSTPGNVLTLDGIDNKTLGRIEARAHAVSRMLGKLKRIVRGPSTRLPGESVDAILLHWSDQAIMDLCIWFVLSNSDRTGENVENFPAWVKDEIQARGEARDEYEAGLLGQDEAEDHGMPLGGCTQPFIPIEATPESHKPNEEIMPPLTPRERRAFLISRRIHPSSTFWTDDRIRAAMQMGM